MCYEDKSQFRCTDYGGCGGDMNLGWNMVKWIHVETGEVCFEIASGCCNLPDH